MRVRPMVEDLASLSSPEQVINWYYQNDSNNCRNSVGLYSKNKWWYVLQKAQLNRKTVPYRS